MTKNPSGTHVNGQEEHEDTFIKKHGRFLIFPTTWFERVNTEHLGNDIFINTDREIRNIYLNGEKLLLPKNEKI